LEFLSVDEAEMIHWALVEDFSDSINPIYPPGVKDINLLASAVFRQHTSIGNTEKYTDPFSNAASLFYGICCDHPFHNGNKRTALVSMLVHLEKNNLTLDGVKENDLYNLVISLAKHTILDDYSHDNKYNKVNPDNETMIISNWIKRHSRYIIRGERNITYRQLDRILKRHSYSLDNPSGNYIDIVRLSMGKKIHIGKIGYPNQNEDVSIHDIKYVRSLCHLKEEDGCDSNTFYGEAGIIDSFINKYRNILKRLANK
jgi:death-on-curing family protein